MSLFFWRQQNDYQMLLHDQYIHLYVSELTTKIINKRDRDTPRTPPEDTLESMYAINMNVQFKTTLNEQKICGCCMVNIHEFKSNSKINSDLAISNDSLVGFKSNLEAIVGAWQLVDPRRSTQQLK